MGLRAYGEFVFCVDSATCWTPVSLCASLRADLHTERVRNTWRNTTMGLMDKIKGMLGGNKKAVTGGIDKAADVVQSKTPDSIDSKVEMAAEKAKDVVEGM